MRLGGNARYLTEIKKAQEIPDAIAWAEENDLRTMMIGIGSNIIWRDQGFDGLILVNKIPGFELQKQEFSSFVTIGAGEPWDSVVARIVNENLSGVEHLSLIPGTAGATPVQNVGAYGREIADVLVCLNAYDRSEKKMVVLAKGDCDFSYRASRFNRQDKDRFFITTITLTLSHEKSLPPFYPTLQAYLTENNITEYTPKNIREAVIAVRNRRLPDPAKVANCGSFFKNPIVGYQQLQDLMEKYPGIKYWEMSENEYKISAAWLLEWLGLKDYHEPNTGMATWKNHPLVLVNEKAKNTSALLAFKAAIIKRVEDKFGITLVQEPELIP